LLKPAKKIEYNFAFGHLVLEHLEGNIEHKNMARKHSKHFLTSFYLR